MAEEGTIVKAVINHDGDRVYFTLSVRNGVLVMQTSNAHMELIPVNTNELWIRLVK
jgi:hypothetical protein